MIANSLLMEPEQVSQLTCEASHVFDRLEEVRVSEVHEEDPFINIIIIIQEGLQEHDSLKS